MWEQGLSLRLAALQLASMSWISLCVAGPPSSLRLQAIVPVATDTTTMPATRAKGGTQHFGSHTPMSLDFRPREYEKTSDVLPGGTTRHFLDTENKSESILAEVSNAKPMSSAEAFTRRLHQEGLPVAKLWENKSALVSLGFNQKGKPGLWFIQKTH
jgi:hypothetical protein